eukprot:TRINITY_DN9096_c0_g1_i1.p1 TRINITY_DN9096_c0_g1~~TRINITY_DN9096_c0_g1_i1.p1  ORF type:complete len:532 (+),score=191.27 TRINITY_DN9096_c0_g1_i1:93-1598(+)
MRVSLGFTLPVAALFACLCTAGLAVLACLDEDISIGLYIGLGAASVITVGWVVHSMRNVSLQLQVLALELSQLSTHPSSMLGSFGDSAACSEVLLLSDTLARTAVSVCEFRSYVPASTLKAADTDKTAIAGLEGLNAPEAVSVDDDDDTDVDDDDDDDDEPAVSPNSRTQSSDRESGGGGRPGLVSSVSKFFRRESIADVAKKRSSGHRISASDASKMTPGKFRNIALVSTNMRRLLGHLKGDLEPAIDGHRRYIAAVIGAAKDAKGMADTFQGDRVGVHFNASLPVPTYRKNACNYSLALVNDLQSQREAAAFGSSVGIEVHTTVGISSGRALIGDQGTLDMRRYTVFGDVVLHTVLLCAAARHYNEVILADASIKQDCEMHFVFKCRARMHFQKSNQLLDACVLMRKRGVQTKKARQEADAKDEEWMYRVDGAEANDPVTLLNNSWESYLEGDRDKAQQVLDKSGLPAHQKEWLTAILSGPDGEKGRDHQDVLDPFNIL